VRKLHDVKGEAFADLPCFLVLSKSRDRHLQEALVEICLYFGHIGVAVKMDFPLEMAYIEKEA
jgi:hypothetical protein